MPACDNPVKSQPGFSITSSSPKALRWEPLQWAREEEGRSEQLRGEELLEWLPLVLPPSHLCMGVFRGPSGHGFPEPSAHQQQET